MLDEMVIHMTEDEIDAYYERMERENLRRYYAIRANRTIKEDRIRLCKLVALTILFLVVCIIFLKLNFQVQQRVYHVAVLQKEIDELRLVNADAKKRIDDSADLHAIQEKAVELGMTYPKQGNIRYYQVVGSDYMYQECSIPK